MYMYIYIYIPKKLVNAIDFLISDFVISELLK